MKKLSALLIAAVLMASLVSCSENRGGKPQTDADPQVKVLATVNDVPITEYDMQQRLKRTVHGEMMNPGATQNVLETLVRDELVYQKSVELGLDKNQEYRQKLNDVEAQVRAFQRQEMSTRLRGYVQGRAEVKDSEAQQYFEKNAKQIQTKFHVLQIFYKGNYSEIVKDHQDLKSGMPFEKVASRRFANLPKNIKAPWDLGELSWNQMPPSWHGIVDRLEPGQVTDIIKGVNDRFWVIKLVNKTVDPKITFATEKEKIVGILRQQKADELYDNMLKEMRTKAKIFFQK